MSTWIHDPWVLAVIIVAALVIVGWFVFAFFSRRLGNAGAPGPCVICAKPGAKWIPCTAERGFFEGLLDALFDRRLHGRPARLRVGHLMDDGRLCPSCYRVETGRLEGEHAKRRHEIQIHNERVHSDQLASEQSRRDGWAGMGVVPAQPVEPPREPMGSRPAVVIPRKAES